MNYFSLNTAAERYAKGRPDFHSQSVKHIKNFLKIDNKLDKALDIACGTGLSSKALLAIATNIYGTDSSQAMIDFAIQKDTISYQIAEAERQPFPDNYFNLITVCSGVHWFDIEKFLLEASRLLKSKSYLILYDNFFIAEMEDDSEFKNWYEEIYLKTFPAPVRNDKYNWTNEQLNKIHFNILKEEKFNNAVSFNKHDWVLYFTTQSNIISAVENKASTYKEIETWLRHELSKFFPNENKQQVIYFGNWIKYLQKTI